MFTIHVLSVSMLIVISSSSIEFFSFLLYTYLPFTFLILCYGFVMLLILLDICKTNDIVWDKLLGCKDVALNVW